MTEIIPDRPWDTREYGRLRLNQAFANDLEDLLIAELDRLHAQRALKKEIGVSVTPLNRKIRRVNMIKELLHGMMHEKGWCECD